MLALGTFIKYRLSFIDTAELHRVVSDRLVTTLYAGFINGGSDAFCCGLLLLLLLFGITLGPQGRGSRRRIRGGGGQLVELRQMGRVAAHVARNGARGVDFERGTATGTKRPRHFVFFYF